MIWSKRKKFPWRRIPSQTSHPKLLRNICCAMLILELAFLGREAGLLFVPFLYRQEGIQVEQKLPAEEEREDGYVKTYGFKLQLKEGLLDFYRKEEYREIQ